MASYEYKVEIAETVSGRTEWWQFNGAAAEASESAIRWCRTVWPELSDMGSEPGGMARIMRRRGPQTPWQQHRAYVVQPNGIVRRTDR